MPTRKDKEHQRKERRTFFRRLRDGIFGACLHALLLCLRYLPFKLSHLTARALGTLAFACLAKDRRRAIHAIADRLQLPRGQARRIALEMFRHHAYSLHEVALLTDHPTFYRRIEVETEGLDHLKRALLEQRGVLLLTAHMGNWELAGAHSVHGGYPMNVIAREVRLSAADRIMNDIRRKNGVNVLLRGKGTLSMARILKKNQLLAILNDLCTRDHRYWEYDQPGRIKVPFLGFPAYTQTGAIQLARRTGAVILTSFIHRETPSRHVIEIGPPIELRHENDNDKVVLDALSEYNRRLEDVIRRYPSQWIWTHKRWRPDLSY